jgi:hypothetical protein
MRSRMGRRPCQRNDGNNIARDRRYAKRPQGEVNLAGCIGRMHHSEIDSLLLDHEWQFLHLSKDRTDILANYPYKKKLY